MINLCSTINTLCPDLTGHNKIDCCDSLNTNCHPIVVIQYEPCKGSLNIIQNASIVGKGIATVQITICDAGWSKAYNRWLAGKTPTDDKVWSSVHVGTAELYGLVKEDVY